MKQQKPLAVHKYTPLAWTKLEERSDEGGISRRAEVEE